jgi:hypothetical protein
MSPPIGAVETEITQHYSSNRGLVLRQFQVHKHQAVLPFTGVLIASPSLRSLEDLEGQYAEGLRGHAQGARVWSRVWSLVPSFRRFFSLSADVSAFSWLNVPVMHQEPPLGLDGLTFPACFTILSLCLHTCMADA